MLDREILMPEIAKREENFFNGVLPSTAEEKLRYMDLQWLEDNSIATAIDKMQGVYSDLEILKAVVTHVYDFVMAQDDSYRIFDNTVFQEEDRDGNDKKVLLSKAVFDVCFFMSICMFLYDTKRIKGMSLREFLYRHSLREYSVKESPNYFDYNNRTREFRESNSDKPDVSSDLILSEDKKMRKYRERLLSKRPVYNYSSEWSAIRKVSEHEWTLYPLLENADKEIQDTEKRIRNLYTDVNKVFESDMDEKYIENLDIASKKFCSKIEKMQYQRFLKLGKFFLDHVNRDKTCYGINLYRFEKELKLYRITSDINRLVNCDDEAAECIIQRAIQMENIVFPQLYEYFSKLPNIEYTQLYADIFWRFMDEVVQSCRLVLDKFVEDGVFGENWEGLFLKTTNELAKAVLYDPDIIDYSLTPRSQKEFQIYLLEPVDRKIICYKRLFYENLEFSRLEIDDDDEI